MHPVYNHQTIEKKWQDRWAADNFACFRAADVSSGQRSIVNGQRYILDMFPYPSAAGLHVGHPEGYTATDIYTRYLRAKGYNVLHPMGWDAFGLPAENYAIKINRHPKQVTAESIASFKRQIQSLGFSYDWSREFSTTNPAYMRWSQWFFLLLYKHGFAYRAKAPVNWCEHDKTVLANEQVIDGRCERCKNEVVQKELEQWFFRVTKYADQLLVGLDKLEWSAALKTMQRNWIGRKEWIDIRYQIKGTDQEIVVSTTRPDTNFGATFIVLAPEHPLLDPQQHVVPAAYRQTVDDYIAQAKKKSEMERVADGRKKTGAFTGLYAVNALNGRELPIYAADFVLKTVGTGAVVGVPGHDRRDFEFAQALDLPIVRVVVGSDGDTTDITHLEQVQEETGTMINSDFLNGLEIVTAISTMMDHLEAKGTGKRITRYQMRDWLVSRQRYWGCPIPIVYCATCGEVPAADIQNPQSIAHDLPIELPDDVDFRPTGESPLAKSPAFQNIKCPKCGKPARRETDTMDGFVDNSWYFFRYLDPKNDKEFASEENVQKWMPVDLYVGGAEHAVGHLIYARFFTKVLHDLGYVDFEEPFLKLVNQGIILGEDGQKMSKSRGNVINPDDVVKEYGADTLRLYEMFLGPLEQMKPWSTRSIIGPRKFLERVWRLVYQVVHGEGRENQELPARLASESVAGRRIKNQGGVHRTIKKVTEDIEALRFNTAIAALMELANAFGDGSNVNGQMSNVFIRLLAPFAPHIAEELWHELGNADSVHAQPWPEYDPQLVVDDQLTIAVQVNGKLRDTLTVAADCDEATLKQLALASEKVKKFVTGEPKKVIVVKNKIVSIVV